MGVLKPLQQLTPTRMSHYRINVQSQHLKPTFTTTWFVMLSTQKAKFRIGKCGQPKCGLPIKSTNLNCHFFRMNLQSAIATSVIYQLMVIDHGIQGLLIQITFNSRLICQNKRTRSFHEFKFNSTALTRLSAKHFLLFIFDLIEAI